MPIEPSTSARPTAASLRAAVELAYTRGDAKPHGDATHLTCPECRRIAEIIDHESGLKELIAALLEIEVHHVEMNAERGRPEVRSETLRIVRAALAKAGL